MIEALQVKTRASELGFDLCGIAAAHPLDPARFDRWLEKGWDANLSYLRERREERLDPSRLLPGARSVVVVAASYAPGPGDPEPAPGELVVARYARGRDYHNVLLKPVRKLAAWLRSSGASVYAEVDAGAVMEKFWAQQAGLGWIGKNGCLIHERLGSWLLLGALITDAALEPDAPHPDRCGDCILCIPACPTGAIVEPRRRAPPARLVQLRAKTPSLGVAETLSLTHAEARRRFEGTPLMRAGRDGLVRSALAVTQVSQSAAQALANDPAPGVRDQARRAISQGR